jgi:hypothetical protein
MAEAIHREGITRARVTQIITMLRLAPKIQEKALSMPDGNNRVPLSERMLRSLGTIADQCDQLRKFHEHFV